MNCEHAHCQLHSSSLWTLSPTSGNVTTTTTVCVLWWTPEHTDSGNPDSHVYFDLPNFCLCSVEELHLSCNEYNQIELPERCHDKLKRLHFNNNAVVSWQNLERVGAVFPALLMLVARANPLTVPVAESPASAGQSPSLLCMHS